MSKIDLKDCFAIILHLERAVDRKHNVERLQEQFKKNKIWKARDMNLMTEEQKEKCLDMKYFHRIPNKNSNPKHIMGWCINAEQHIEILNYIVAEKLDNVIIFEDDALLINKDDDLVIDYNGEDYFHLGGWFYKPNKLCKQHAIYYLSHKIVRNMLDYLNNPKKLKTIDYMFSNYIQPNFKWGYSNKFYQEGDSLITNGCQNKVLESI